MVSIHPIDCAALEKGDRFTVEDLKRITGKEPGTDAFRFAVMSLQSLIHGKTEMTAKIDADGSLRILTDAEASVHNHRLFREGLRTMIQRNARSLMVDRGALVGDQLVAHDRQIQQQGFYMAAIAGARRQVKITAKAEIAEKK